MLKIQMQNNIYVASGEFGIFTQLSASQWNSLRGIYHGTKPVGSDSIAGQLLMHIHKIVQSTF